LGIGKSKTAQSFCDLIAALVNDCGRHFLMPCYRHDYG
jgi:hypothetical protein